MCTADAVERINWRDAADDRLQLLKQQQRRRQPARMQAAVTSQTRYTHQLGSHAGLM